MSKDITLSEEQLALTIRTAVQAALAAAPKPEKTPEQEWAEGRENAKQFDEHYAQFKRVACLSPLTRATFDAVIAPSSAFAAGRIVNFDNYRYPEGVDKPQDEGGLAPMAILEPDGIGGYKPTQQWRQWRYENFDLIDRRHFVGKSADVLRIADPKLQAQPVK